MATSIIWVHFISLQFIRRRSNNLRTLYRHNHIIIRERDTIACCEEGIHVAREQGVGLFFEAQLY